MNKLSLAKMPEAGEPPIGRPASTESHCVGRRLLLKTDPRDLDVLPRLSRRV
jgi:hypothetical protein